MKSGHLNQPYKTCTSLEWNRTLSSLHREEPAGEPQPDSSPHTWTPQRRVHGSVSSPLRLTASFTPLQHNIKSYKNEHVGGFPAEGAPDSEHQPQVRVTGSVNTNLLLSEELENLRQRRLSIPIDPTFLLSDSFTETTSTTSVLVVRGAPHFMTWKNKPRRGYFSVFADWAGQTSPSAARLCFFFFLPLLPFSSWRAAHPRRHTQRCRPSGTPSLLATCCHSNPPGRAVCCRRMRKGVVLMCYLQKS